MPGSDRMLLKTHVEKMSVLGLDTILMKTSELKSFYHDVDEREGDSCYAEIPAPKICASLVSVRPGLRPCRHDALVVVSKSCAPRTTCEGVRSQVSECGSLVPLFLPLTRQRPQLLTR